MISETFSQIKQRVFDFWAEHYEDVMSAALVFLLVSLAFGIGVMVGSKMLENQQISITCPAEFWRKN